MLIAIASLCALGVVFGLILGLAARRFHVEPTGLAAELETMMPGSNCGQCGFPGCSAAAAALAAHEAAPDCCPPGGRHLAAFIAQKLGAPLELDGFEELVPKVAGVKEEICIGCTKCFKACPTDAVVGAMKQIHVVMREACTGCAKCEPLCPTGAIELAPLPPVAQHWVWPRPVAG